MINKLYNISPVFFQNIIISVYGYYWKNRRYGNGFLKELKEVKQRETFNAEEWKKFQTNELRKFLHHSFVHVPFYNQSYKKHGFKEDDFLHFQLEDLKELPFLEKEDLRLYGQTTLLATNRKKGKFYSSSGSTGKPTHIYITPEFHRKWNALYEARVRNWAGVNYKMARGMIGGRMIMDKRQKKPPFYRYNVAEKQTYFSAFHISNDNVNNYVEGIQKNKVEYMVGYTNSNYFLADFIVKNNLSPEGVKAVLTSSEKLTPEMRKIISAAYNCKVFDGYSGVEACGLISENEYGELLFSPDSGILELLDINGNEVKEGMEGEVISTGFLNYDQPLIRYRIGDMATKSSNQKSKSGMSMPIIDEIIGRVEDTVIAPDGSKLVRFHGIFIDLEGVIMGQVIQETLTKYIVKIVTDTNFKEDDINTIINRMKLRLSDTIEVTVFRVNEIEKEANGKIKAVISKIA